MAEQEEDFSSLPLPDRFAHKNWKVRKEGYEAAAKEFDNAQTESDPVVRDFLQDSGLWKTAVSDANVAAHQEALVALCSFLKIAGSQGCIRTRNLTLALLVEKGLTSTKPTAKQKAMEAILLYVELDKPDPVVEELLPVLSHKLPKVVGATLSAFTAICHEFGCKTVEPKQIVKVLPKAFGHADKNVRTEAQNLTTELYRWLREGMKPLFWNDLKPVQQQDLEKLFEKVKDEPPPKPDRLLKSQQAAADAAAAAASSAGADGGAGDDDDEPIDLEPEYMSVDVMAKIPKDLEERLASTKWKDRKEALDDLHTAINVPAMEEGHFDDIMRSLAKCMKDANIMVVTIAANCIELFAKGLRKNFAKYRAVVMKSVLERLREKKASVTDALAAALDAICAATSISDCLEDTMEAMKDKNPLVKLESTRLLVRALKNTREAPSLPDVKVITESATKLLADSQETQRNAAAELMGVLLKIMGERIMNTHLEGLDDIRKTKIKEYSESAEVRAKYKPKAAAPPPPKTTAPPPLGQKRPPAGVKKTGAAAPAPAKKPTIVDDEPTPAPALLQPKLTARPGVSKPGAPTSGLRGLKPPTGIANKRPNAATAASASPRRPQRSPTPEEAATPAPKLSRGLTGRHLSKPPTSTSESFPEPPMSTNPTFSSVERHEFDDLRAETDRLRSSNDALRLENAKLTSQLRDLQEQNTQLIEDHTRDVLSIKAKETQLVRARSDAESAEQTAAQLQREVDRLKRELGRADRGETQRAPVATEEYEYRNGSADANLDVFQESERGLNGSAQKQPASTKPRRALASPVARGKENDLHALSAGSDSGYTGGAASQSEKLLQRSRLLSSRTAGIPRPGAHASPARPTAASVSGTAMGFQRAHVAAMSPPPGEDDADNEDYDARALDDVASPSNGPAEPLPPIPRTAYTGISRGVGGTRSTGTAVATSTGDGTRSTSSGSSTGAAAGQESWRRAAEVTQNLKARIELMKQRQGLSRPGGVN